MGEYGAPLTALPVTGAAAVWWMQPGWLGLTAVSMIMAGGALMFLFRKQAVRP